MKGARGVVQVLVSTMIGNTAVAGALALLALVAMKLRRPAAAHVLWLLVIVKLLTPWGWRVQVIEESAQTALMTQETPSFVARAQRMEVPRAETKAAGAVAVSEPRERAAIVNPAPVQSHVPARSRALSIPSVLVGLWIAGSIAWLVVTITRIGRFRRLLRTAHDPHDHLLDELASVAARMQLTHLPELSLVDAAVSPMLWFLGRGPVRLILPRRLVEATSVGHREGVFAHELAHLKRGDQWVRLFEIVATTVLWWHPLLWLARRGLREAEEQCCDGWVVALLPHARREYADALVDALEMLGAPARGLALPAGATGLGHVQHLRRRLTMILTGTGPKSLSRMGKITVVAIAIAVVPLVPVRGEAQTQQAGPAAAGGGATASVAATGAGASMQPTGADEATRRAVDALLDRAVQDSDQNVRNAALSAIARFGPRAIPALLDGVKNERTAEFSRNLLAGLGLSSMDALLAALDSPDAQVRKEALRTLTQIVASAYTSRPEFAGIMQAAMTGAGGGIAPGFSRPPGRGFGGYRGPAEMEGEAIFVEGATAPVIEGGVMPEPVKRLIPPVTKAARDEDTGVRRAALQLMSHLVVVAVPAGRTGELMPALERAMTDADADVRADAIQALQFAGPAAGSATAALTKAVSDENDRVRSAALMSLRAIGPAARDATPAVIAALKDPQPPIRALAADTLGALQAPPPPPATPGPPFGAEGGGPTGLPLEATTAPAQAIPSTVAQPLPAPTPTPAPAPRSARGR